MIIETQVILPGFGTTPCRLCGGNGKVVYLQPQTGRQSEPVTCCRCDGTGDIFETKQEKS